MPRYGYDYRDYAYGAYPAPPYDPMAWGTAAFAGVPYWGPWGWPPFAPVGYGAYPAYDRDYPPRRRPEESPTYGRGGDRALRRWARSHGYDLAYRIPPREPPGYGGYDRGYRARTGPRR